MKKQVFFIILLLVGFQNLLQGQDAFYRSYVSYKDYSFFSFFPAKEKTSNVDEKVKESVNMDTHFINWNELNYFCTLYKVFELTGSGNFVIEPWIVKGEEEKQVKALVYQDLLSIVVDSDLTLKRLIFLNLDFRSLLFEKLYNSEFVNSVSTSYSKLKLYSLFSFTGKDGLIDLFIRSKFYSKDNVLEVTDTPYIPNPYKALVVEARGLNIVPSLFPSIYTYDKDGKLILVYSFLEADKNKIIDNGYAHYIKDEQSLIKEDGFFYTAALSLTGDMKTDIIISRDSFLKFFGSEEAIKNLKEGNFYIVT